MKFKKVIATVAVLGMLIGTTACTVREKKTEVVESDPSGTSTEQSMVYGSYDIGETARDGSVEMSVDSVEIVVWEQVDYSGVVYETHNLIKAHVSITNLGEEDLDLQPRDVRGFIDNEQISSTQVEAAYESLGIKGDLIESAVIHPGRSETGYILYEYYRNWSVFEIQYKDTALDFELNFSTDDVIHEQAFVIPGATDGTNTTESDVTEPTETTNATESSSGTGLVIPGASTADTTPTTSESGGTGLTIPAAG